MVTAETVAVAVVVALLAYLIASTHIRRGDSMSEVKRLRGMVEVLQADHFRDAQEIEKLRRDLSEAQARIRELESRLAVAAPVSEAREGAPAKRLLAVVGSDGKLSFDLAALRAVESECGIEVRRCRPARWESFKAIVNRARMDGRKIHYVHFSVHAAADYATGDGVALFEDGPVNGEQLSGVLNDVQAVMVAGCSSDLLGDLLRIAPAVVTFTEPISNKDAAEVTRVFWTSVGEGLSPYRAYQETRRKISADLREFWEFHGEAI